jgi:uncharacterized protein YggE
MNFSMRGLLGVAFAGTAVFAAIACTPETHVTVAGAEQQTGIAVSGTGRVSVVPDVGLLQLGVQSTQPTVQAARDRAAAAMEAVRASLRSNNVDEKDIATSGFNIQPQYDFRSSGGAPTITGYMVSNLVTVKVRQINNLSRVLDNAVAAGGDDVRVNSISFSVDQPERHREEARKLAVEDARRHAEQLAAAAGVSLGRARSINEMSDSGIPVPIARPEARSTQSDVPTPISPGETDITVLVSVVYDIE